jgi:hypothetical protein
VLQNVTAAAGKLVWGYHPAAVLRDCTLTRGAHQWALSATIESADAFRVTQRPLTFVVRNDRWPVQELQMTGASLTATLGPKEIPYGAASPTS